MCIFLIQWSIKGHATYIPLVYFSFGYFSFAVMIQIAYISLIYKTTEEA